MSNAIYSSFLGRPQPVHENAGFTMPGYHVWCGSAVEQDGLWHLYASRWPSSREFPEGYRTHSEIVHATSRTPNGPFAFSDIALPAREGMWDGGMTHNPYIIRAGGKYVLYYNASAKGERLRKVGFAFTDSPYGPWTRLSEPLPLEGDCNNPAALVDDDGTILLVFRNESLKVSVARAPRFGGPYSVIGNDIFPQARIEDFFLFKQNGKYYLIFEDNANAIFGQDRWGGLLESEDGIGWTVCQSPLVYTHDLLRPDGSQITLERRERPYVVFGQGVNYLYTSALYQGRAYNVCQEFKPE